MIITDRHLLSLLTAMFEYLDMSTSRVRIFSNIAAAFTGCCSWHHYNIVAQMKPGCLVVMPCVGPRAVSKWVNV